jgi:hypothetical protein
MATSEQLVKDMLYCPRCLSLLIKGEGTRLYQDLIDHVCSPNSPLYPKEYFICSNKDCLTRVNDDFWDWYGTFYYSKDYDKDFFLNSCHDAVNSGQRQFNLQQKKKGITFLYLIWFKAYIELTPRYDEAGLNRTGYSPKIQACTRTSLKNGWTMYIPGIHMLFFCIKQFDRALAKYMEDVSNKYNLKDLIRELEYEPWDKRWWKRLSKWYNNFRYPGLKEILCEKKT